MGHWSTSSSPARPSPELAELRRRVDVPIAADESIRKADDPLWVVRAGAADVAVLKVAPLGGVAKLLDIAGEIDVPVVVSSALDSAVGIGRGLLAAAALPELRHACGLGTGGLFVEDVAEPLTVGRRPSARRARRSRSGPAGRAGRAARAASVVDRPHQGLLRVRARRPHGRITGTATARLSYRRPPIRNPQGRGC